MDNLDAVKNILIDEQTISQHVIAVKLIQKVVFKKKSVFREFNYLRWSYVSFWNGQWLCTIFCPLSEGPLLTYIHSY